VGDPLRRLGPEELRPFRELYDDLMVLRFPLVASSSFQVFYTRLFGVIIIGCSLIRPLRSLPWHFLWPHQALEVPPLAFQRPFQDIARAVCLFSEDYVGHQKIKEIVDGCRLGHAFEQWCIAYAAQTSFQSVPDGLHRLIRDTFSGWTQSRVNEKANKVWRDRGRTENASGICGQMALWESLTAGHVFDEFQRTEIAGNDGVAIETERLEEDPEGLFTDPPDRLQGKLGDGADEIAALSQENLWLETFDKVTKKSGKAFNPESEQLLTAELRFLRKLHEGDLWHMAGDAWVTSLLPVGQLIRVVSTNTFLWVLKTNECAALCWPAEQVAMNVWRKDPSATSLSWYTCFDLADVEVLSTKAMSPKSLFVQD